MKADDTIRLQDDFAAAANQELITSVRVKDELVWGPDTDATDLLQTRFRELLRDESLTGANAEVMRTFESLVLDWDERDRLGVEPIRKYIDDIQNICYIDGNTVSLMPGIMEFLRTEREYSISFPLISSGIFGGNLDNPVAESTKQCLRAYKKFTSDHPDYDIDVKLCAFAAFVMKNQ